MLNCWLCYTSYRLQLQYISRLRAVPIFTLEFVEPRKDTPARGNPGKEKQEKREK